jgi:succinate dehydrogenase/fumarate reductase-like Fe-S protein
MSLTPLTPSPNGLASQTATIYSPLLTFSHDESLAAYHYDTEKVISKRINAIETLFKTGNFEKTISEIDCFINVYQNLISPEKKSQIENFKRKVENVKTYFKTIEQCIKCGNLGLATLTSRWISINFPEQSMKLSQYHATIREADNLKTEFFKLVREANYLTACAKANQYIMLCPEDIEINRRAQKLATDQCKKNSKAESL